ncbi:MAG: peptidylprolyl isomerase [Flavobacteriales bacterium]|nr:peptidylprolyl isomerase [Flavobacteriales bacterium]
MKQLFIITCAILVFSSCKYLQQSKSKKQALARVNNTYLYIDDLEGVIPPGTAPEDSIKLVNQFIQNWIREQLVLQKAEMNLSNDLKNVEKQLEEYRKSLIIYAYQEKLVNQNLDTVVTDSEIAEYYEKNKANFELRENIVKADYAIFNRSNKDLPKIKLLFRSDKKDQQELFAELCKKYAYKYALNDTNWVRFDDLLKEIPLPADNQELFLSTRKYVEIEDSMNVYLVNIKAYKIKESQSPLAFEKNRIRSIILNQRKLSLLAKMEEDTYQDALNKKEFEIFAP